jgi:ribonuclease J
MDHCGNVGALRADVPIVASPESIVIMKGMRDTASASIEGDTAYFSPRIPSDEAGLYLSSDRKADHQGRDFCCTERPSEALTTFLSRKPGQDGRNAKKLEPGSCCSFDEASFPFEISAHPVDHSIYGAVAYILRGDVAVAYTGDFRLHGKNEDSTREFVKAAKEASVLITEGTRAGRAAPQDGESTSEQSVCDVCRGAVEGSSGLVIADFSARNFERLESFQEIAEKTGRELVVPAKDMYMLDALLAIGGASISESLRVYDEIGNRSRKWEAEVVLPRYGDRYIDHASIRDNPENFILCFSFFDMLHLLDIKPSGGTYIYSACEAFNEEMEIDFVRLWHWLGRFNIAPAGFSVAKEDGGRYSSVFDKQFHASGHASREDLAWVIDQIDPDQIVPIHTESREWFAENFENVILAEEGVAIEF